MNLKQNKMKSGHEIGKKLLSRLILESEAEAAKHLAIAKEMKEEYEKCFETKLKLTTKKPVEGILRIEKSLHKIYLLGVEMTILNAKNVINHKDKEIVCTLGAIQRQIDVVIKDLES